jgi:hypothetical protein
MMESDARKRVATSLSPHKMMLQTLARFLPMSVEGGAWMVVLEEVANLGSRVARQQLWRIDWVVAWILTNVSWFFHDDD